MSTRVRSTRSRALPDHTQLPYKDDSIVKNMHEHPQSILLTDCLTPVLETIHPDGDYCIGQDTGIYWRVPKRGEVPQRAAVCPDWFYVAGRYPGPEGVVLRSYVLWQEKKRPLAALEFSADDGSEERDVTPQTGKFWIYERKVRPLYYGILIVETGDFEFNKLVRGRFRKQEPNARGHHAIPQLGVELGIWKGRYQNKTLPWLRWFDNEGELLPTGHERAERLAEQLRNLGIDPQA